MRSRVLRWLLITAVVSVGAYWYASPYLALYSLISAAERKDADSINAKIDYQAVRHSLKGQLAAITTSQVSGAASNSDMGKAGGALGSALVISMADRIIDALVTPETLMRAIQDGRMRPSTSSRGDDPSGSKISKKVEWSFSRPTLNRLVMSAKEAETSKGYGLAVVVDRHGFADWKVSELRLHSTAK